MLYTLNKKPSSERVLLKMCYLYCSFGTEWVSLPFLDSKYTESQGQIEFLRCCATLKTKSQTKFYIEFHSSCLESKALPVFYCFLHGFLLILISSLPLTLIKINGHLGYLYDCKEGEGICYEVCCDL